VSDLIPNVTRIPAPRTPFFDERTGLVSREWYRFLYNLFTLTGSGGNFTSLTDLQKGPPDVSIEALRIDPNAPSVSPSDSALVSQVADIDAQLNALESQPERPCEEYNAETQKDIDGLEMLPRAELGTMAALQQANLPWITFDTTASGVPPDVGTAAWDGGTTLGIQATPNVLIKVGESEYIYARASAAITKGQVCYHTGAVGSSGVTTVAPAPIGLTDANQIVGIAAESILINDFGLILISGDIKGFDTTGSSVGEVWADGDPLYYNPAFVGSMTKVKPSAPNMKTYMGEVINAGSGGSGSMHVRIVPGSTLGGTDSNVQFGTLINKDLIEYDSVAQYWKNVAPSSIIIGTATNLAGGTAGAVPYQTAPSTTTFLNIGAALQVLKVNAGATAPEWVSGAALTKVDDTNVTLTLGGTPASSLLAATSLTLGWTGQLGLTRGGTNASLTASAGSVAYSTASALALNTAGNSGDWLQSAGTSAPAWTAPAALTKTDDTNVTLTLGGSASTALLNAASLTLGWTGQLAVTRGGTGTGTAFTTGSVVFAGASGTYSQNNAKFFWDNTNSRLGINTALPGSALTVGASTDPASLGATALFASSSNSSGSTETVVGIGQGGTSVGSWVGLGAGVISGGSPYFSIKTRPNAGGASVERLRIDGAGNLGLGVTPSAWNSAFKVIEVGVKGNALFSQTSQYNTIVSSNAYYDSVGWKYGNTGASSYYDQLAGVHKWFTAASGTAGNAITFTQAMTLDTSGNLGVGTASPVNKLQVNGSLGRNAPVTKTGNFTLAATENWLICNGTGTITVTLPAASSWTGREVMIKTIAAFTVVSASSNVVPLAGGAAGTAILAATAGAWATLVSDGTNWIIMQA